MASDKQRVTQLYDLGHAAYRWRRGCFSPRQSSSQLLGLVVAFAVLGLQLAVQMQAYAPVAFLVGFAAWAAMMRWSKIPSSHAEEVDRLLALYEPVDKQAYRSLQQEAYAAGGLTCKALHEWLIEEAAAFDRVADAQRPRPVLKFLSREI